MSQITVNGQLPKNKLKIEEKEDGQKDQFKTPHQLADDRLIMAMQYGQLGERLVELKKLFALWWESFRKDYKSDASCERGWDLTKEGIEMMEIKNKMAVKKIKMSAIKTKLEVLNNEARNQW